MKETLKLFSTVDLRTASHRLLDKLGLKYSPGARTQLDIHKLFSKLQLSKATEESLNIVSGVYFVAQIDDRTFANNSKTVDIDAAVNDAKDDKYKGLFVFALQIKSGVNVTRTMLANLTRAFNKYAVSNPVAIFIKQEDQLSLSICERTSYTANQQYRIGEKLGRVNILRNIDCSNPNRAHIDILNQLDAAECKTFFDLYRKWMTEFDISLLNKQFYKELQDWFYWAVDEIKLPQVIYSNQDDEQQAKNFIVRMLSRLMFCWFIKERGLIDKRLLELTDFHDKRYPIVNDIENEDFLDSNSYYRGILQNMFFNGLNKQKKVSKKDFKCTNYLPDNFDYNLFMILPFLNCGTFDPLEEDFNKESIEDNVMSIPNRLFYGDDENKGINQIFCSYHFTIEENTPLDIDIALDPEMLGLVFENLLAEIDPNNDDATTKSIRKATGSYYTPRPVIQSMVNESLLVYLKKRISFEADENKTEFLTSLIYHNLLKNDRYNRQIVECLYGVRALDPACGSGAFPMGMLQRIVDLLKIVDPGNSLWLDMMLEPIKDRTTRENFKKQLAGHQDDYSRKLGIIQNCIYGIDIQPIAVQITKLRFFISLLIDQKIDKKADNAGVTPLPNLETKIVCADSLKSLSADVFEEKLKKDMILEREKYYQPDVTSDERKEIAGRIADMMDVLYPTFAVRLGMKQVSNKAVLKKWFMTGSVNAPFFDLKTFFPEIEEGFDIVIGNPPYGGFKIEDDVKEGLGLGNKDPYGAFIARFLGNGARITPLKYGGVLSYIVSDTFMTIGTHLKLRQQMMHNKIYKMVRMSRKTFSATVNTVVIVCEKCRADASDSAIKDNICQMADMSNIDIHEDFEHFMDILSRSTMKMTSAANEEYAIYNYEQKLIRNSSNLPFFVASPKLFELMNDTNPVQRKTVYIEGDPISCRTNLINGKKIQFYKLGDLSEVKIGLQTGDNPAYIFQNPEARGTYRDISSYSEWILNDEDMIRIQKDDELRLSIISKGISLNDPSSQRYFGGRYIALYDKGGESDIEEGWMPNYYVATNYYIDWSEWAVNRMQTLTIAQRKIENHEKKKITEKDKTTLSGVFRNSHCYFLKSITYSKTGEYAPTFRLGTGGPFDQKSSFISVKGFPEEYCIGVLSSKLMKFVQKTMLNQSVDFGVDEMNLLPFPSVQIPNIQELVLDIVKKQKLNPRYDYASHEQQDIDSLIYKAYGLNDEDIDEVEKWFARRYPKLAAAQRSNLEKLKKV